MSELITNPNVAENRLRFLVESYRNDPLATTETYAFFDVGDEASVEFRDYMKDQFLKGEVRNPILYFPQLDRDDVIEQVIETENKMVKLMAESTDLAHDLDREAVLYDLLRVRQLEMAMLLMACELSQPDASAVKKHDFVEPYNRVNDEINGQLEPARFNGLLQRERQRAQSVLQNEKAPKEVKQAAAYFLDNTGEITQAADTVPPVDIEPERFAKLSEFIKSKYNDLIELVPDKPKDEKYTAEEMADIFRKAHEIRQTGWSVRLQPGKSSIDTRQNEQTTVIGTERERTAKNARGILVHENGVHVQRRINGDKSGDPLLAGLGLPWYLASEEGSTTIFQDAIEGKVSEAGQQHYLTIGFTRGLDGFARDFRGVYELEWRRRVIGQYLKKPEEELDFSDHQSKAYATVLRARRGTSADTPGVAYTKDIAYYLGNQKMWEILLDMVDRPEAERDQVFDQLLAAKYDPTNPVHAKIVQRTLEDRR